MHDPRVGRFFAVDPLAPNYPHYTPYSFSGNKVIAHIELEGLEEYHFTLKYNEETKKSYLAYTGKNNVYHRIRASSSDKIKILERTTSDDNGGGNGLTYWVGKNKTKVYTLHNPYDDWGIGVFMLWGSSSSDMWKGAKKTFSGSFSVEEKDIPSFLMDFNAGTFKPGKGQSTYKPPKPKFLDDAEKILEPTQRALEAFELGQDIGKEINNVRQTDKKYQISFYNKDGLPMGANSGEYDDYQSAEKRMLEIKKVYKNNNEGITDIKIEEIK